MIEVRNLRKEYQTKRKGEGRAVRDVSFEVKSGEFYTLLGPSGCGKTTTLRVVAGLERLDDGQVLVNGEVVASRTKNVSVERRNLGMVFQSYAIWPHMTVFGNVEFPLKQGGHRLGGAERRRRVTEVLELVQMDAYADRPAPLLSGGQQQRVALARALVARPPVLLLDEPLSNLDAKLRREMRVELKELTRRLGITTLYVTHDQVEALDMSDRLAVMSRGVILQDGVPDDVYRFPNSVDVAQFVGEANVIEGIVVGGSGSLDDPVCIETAYGRMRARAAGRLAPGTRAALVVRPECVRLNLGNSREDDNVLVATVSVRRFEGDHIICELSLPGMTLRARFHPWQDVSAGETVSLRIPTRWCSAVALSDATDRGEEAPGEEAPGEGAPGEGAPGEGAPGEEATEELD